MLLGGVGRSDGGDGVFDPVFDPVLDPVLDVPGDDRVAEGAPPASPLPLPPPPPPVEDAWDAMLGDAWEERQPMPPTATGGGGLQLTTVVGCAVRCACSLIIVSSTAFDRLALMLDVRWKGILACSRAYLGG